MLRPHGRGRKIIIAVLIVCILAAAAIWIYWKALVLNYAEKELRGALKGYSVHIAGREVTDRSLTFRGIEVAKRGQKVFKAGEFRADFRFIPLITKRVSDFSIKDVVIYEKLKIPEAHGTVIYSRGVVALGKFSARILDGAVEGGALVKMDKGLYYAAAVTLIDLQLEKMVEIFELNDKLALDGLVSGSIELSGDGARLTRLKGKLKAAADGGVLTIKSQEWLERIAAYAKADIKIIEENFKNYSYNEGSASLGLKGTSIVLDAHLNGIAGKRDIIVSLHDFNQ